MDQFIFEYINNLARVSPTLDFIGVFLAGYFQYALIIVTLFFLLWPIFLKNNRLLNINAALIAFASAGFSRFILANAIRFFYHRPRPFLAITSVKQLTMDRSEQFLSFPSGHAAFFFALAMGAYFYNKKLGVILFISAALMGIARIFAGLHWPSDIIGGAIVGVFGAWCVNLIAKKLLRI